MKLVNTLDCGSSIRGFESRRSPHCKIPYGFFYLCYNFLGMNIIEIKNLKFTYDNKEVILDDVSLEIKKGSYTTIIGHNGSGKSTLARLIAGLLDKSDGDIWINGLLLKEENLKHIRKEIGIVFQNPDNQFIGSSVKDDIAFGLENKCINPKEMDDIIFKYASRVGMENFLDKEPHLLSGGQKQRVAIASVLAINPSIIIFDEATSMLDPKGKKEIKDLIKNLHKDSDKTIISITHDIEEAYHSDYIYVLNKGKIFKKGKPNEIFNNSKELNNIKLDVPFNVKIKEELEKNKIKIESYNSVEEIVENLCRLKLKN